MRECFRLAAKGKGYVSPNPLVGAVLVRKGVIVARGYHKRFGDAHAEVECLRAYSGSLAHTTLYVNLEPCSHDGKTPPCADLIIQRGIKKVVVAMKDPNPHVAGKGIAKLRRAGVEVVTGVLKAEALRLNRWFVTNITARRPYVHLKIAQTRDGFIGRNNAPLQYITSLPSRKLVHRWRSEYDAVLVGAGTIRADNPLLNVRLAKGRDPAVVVLDGRLSVSGEERVFASAKTRAVLLCTSIQAERKHRNKISTLRSRGVSVLSFASRAGELNLRQVLRELYKRKIGSLLVEAGSTTVMQFLDKRLADELSIFISPKVYGEGVPLLAGKIAGQLQSFMQTTICSMRKVGNDLLVTGTIQ